MAKKGQKFKNYSKELKETILKRYFQDKVPTSILAREYGIPRESIKNWVYKANHNELVLSDTKEVKRGRPKKILDENIDYKERYEILKKFQDFIIARREKK